MAYRIAQIVGEEDAPTIVVDVYRIISDDEPEEFICTKSIFPYTASLWERLLKAYGEGKTVEKYPDDNPTVVWVY